MIDLTPRGQARFSSESDEKSHLLVDQRSSHHSPGHFRARYNARTSLRQSHTLSQRHQFLAGISHTSRKRAALLRQQNNPNFEPHYRTHIDPPDPLSENEKKILRMQGGIEPQQTGTPSPLPPLAKVHLPTSDLWPISSFGQLRLWMLRLSAMM